MERERLFDIRSVFRIGAFDINFGKIATMRDASRFKQGENIINYGDFICVTCILCFDTLESSNCT
jgi:hypothetical protein